MDLKMDVFVVLIIIFCISTGLCRNQAELRKELLTNPNFDVQLRPEDQTNVTVKLILTSLNKLDTVNQELSTTFQLHLNLKYVNNLRCQTLLNLHLTLGTSELWSSVEQKTIKRFSRVEDALFLLQDDIVPLRVTNNGTVTWVPRLSPRTTCEINIANFPADEQICLINITSWGHITDEINLLLPSPEDGSGVVLDLYNDMAWDLYKADAKQNSRVYSADMAFSNIEFSFHFKREIQFYITLLIAPFCCIAFLMTLVFLIPSKHQTEKISFSVTLLLSFQMYLNLLPTLLPPVFSKEDPNVFGDYILGVTIFGTVTTTVLVIELVCIHMYHIFITRREDSDEDKPPQVPYGVNIVLFFVFVIVFAVAAGMLHRPLNN